MKDDQQKRIKKLKIELRRKSITIKPKIQIGKKGITDAFIKELNRRLKSERLIKIRVLKNAPVTVDEACSELEKRINDLLIVDVRGRTITVAKLQH